MRALPTKSQVRLEADPQLIWTLFLVKAVWLGVVLGARTQNHPLLPLGYLCISTSTCMDPLGILGLVLLAVRWLHFLDPPRGLGKSKAVPELTPEPRTLEGSKK